MKISTRIKLSILILPLLFSTIGSTWAQALGNKKSTSREHISIDSGWSFAFGHPFDTSKDFTTRTGYFSYWAKAGYGDGAASKNFDDRMWQTIDLPHDWAVSLPFDSKGTHSHGYKAIGLNFPENSVGWYRKTIFIPETDLGQRISIDFDGVFRNSIVWVNGFYLGEEHSGYAGFSYDITDYLNYGGDNVVAVRVDNMMEEGWFYEGAGIYRHTWITKTAPLHVARYGTFVTSEVKDNLAKISAQTTVENNGDTEGAFDLEQTILDADGHSVGKATLDHLVLKPGTSGDFACAIEIQDPKLWSIETPYLHKLMTTVKSSGKVIDTYETTFGIRTIRFDANEGFFLNGKRVEIKGTNNHQDHAGVGVAIPDALQDFRIKRLKEMGSNAYRCSHNPPTPELLDACDRLGMLVLDENRLMGTNQEHFDLLKRMILRDRNHPSVILWSLGNEEWAIEGNITGARITKTMQNFVQTIDSTRAATVAVSGGWDNGSGQTVQVMGYNYIVQGNIDEHHKKFPWQSGVGTEESNTIGTRGIYVDDKANGRMAASNRMPENVGTESGWQFYTARPFLAGLFYWTGFDYRGEPNPLGWPAVSSQFGIVDACGFPKDIFYYLKSVWTDEPVLHLLPHWNWEGKEGQAIQVWAYTNCDQVELFLNKKSQGKKMVPKDSHVEWTVNYRPGVLLAKGYKNGKKIIEQQVETTGDPAAVNLLADRERIKADGKDVSVVTIRVNDKKGLLMPLSSNEITFSVDGPGKIIGVGNGDPGSHEPDQFLPSIQRINLGNWLSQNVDGTENRPEVAADFNDSEWKPAFRRDRTGNDAPVTATVFRAHFSLGNLNERDSAILYQGELGQTQYVFVNGRQVDDFISKTPNGPVIHIPKSVLRKGDNVVAVVAVPYKERRRNGGNFRSGGLQLLTPAEPWKRKVFNGLAQVIVQSTGQPGEITLKAGSPGLTPAILTIRAGE